MLVLGSSEMKKKDRRIAELEKQLEQGDRPAAADRDVSAAHYAQLKQVQASCSERTADLERSLADSEAKRTAAEQQLVELKTAVDASHRAVATAREELQAERTARHHSDAARQHDLETAGASAEAARSEQDAAELLAEQRLSLLRAAESDRNRQQQAAAVALRRERASLTHSLEAALALRRELNALRSATASTIASTVREVGAEVRLAVVEQASRGHAAASRASSDATARQRALEGELAAAERRLAESAKAIEAAAATAARERADQARAKDVGDAEVTALRAQLARASSREQELRREADAAAQAAAQQLEQAAQRQQRQQQVAANLHRHRHCHRHRQPTSSDPPTAAPSLARLTANGRQRTEQVATHPPDRCLGSSRRRAQRWIGSERRRRRGRRSCARCDGRPRRFVRGCTRRQRRRSRRLASLKKPAPLCRWARLHP